MTSREYRRKQEKRKRAYRRVLTGAGIFFGLMLLCTLISKSIYASQLPQVTLEKPKRMALTHTVEAIGTIWPSRELALNTRAGLRVKEVYVSPGDVVEEGQPLFCLDTDYVKELIADLQVEANKAELQVATMQSNQKIAEEEKNREMERAGEDAVALIQDAQKVLERAREDEAMARQDLDKYVEDTPEGEDEELWKAWEEGRENLLRILTEKARARQDAEEGLEKAYTQANRSVEDNLSQEKSDASLGAGWMDFNHIRDEIAALQKFLENDGMVCAQNAGTVTQVGVQAGQLTADSAAVTFANGEEPLAFEVLLDQEQKKYVEPKSQGELSLGSFRSAGSKKIPVTVDYLAEEDSMPGSFRARMLLPLGTGTIGQNGIFTLSVQTDSFSCCIPLGTLHVDENKSSFVYVLEETDTILGKELVARKRMVTVLDQNEGYAAIEPGAVDEDTRLIYTSTKEYKDGDVVRLKE